MSENSQHPRYKSIAKSFTELQKVKKRFDVVVVGSGYGGSIAASRMARIGKQVCLLERGREILPGDYPATLTKVQEQLQIRTDTQPDKPIGAADALYDFRANEDVSVLVGCGLGGTSLINANVALETDPVIFSNNDRPWPKEFRNGKGPRELERYYEMARQWLGATPYPDEPGANQDTLDGYPRLNKLDALAKSADALGVKIKRPPINVNFEDKKDNGHGLAQPKCNLCGDCCSGCNHGSKNTTLMNYLPDAARHGAEIYCNSRVDYIEKAAKGGWLVHVTETRDNPLSCAVSAEIVILAAGTLGSTEIMLRSKARGLSCSDTLGQGFSGNGDVLAFGYNSYWRDNDHKSDARFREDGNSRYESVYAIGQGENQLTQQQLPGPCITGLIDLRDPRQPLSHHRVIEEGVIPGAFSSILPAGFFFAAAQKAHFLKYGSEQAEDRLQDIQQLGEAVQAGMGNLSEWCYRGAVSRTQTYLGMSVDDAAGELALKNNHVVVDWPDAGTSSVIEDDNDAIAKASDAVQGQFLPNLVWDSAFGNKLVSVHPLGGCCMADSAEHGVVNHACQVFSGNQGDTLHQGLYICDGSVIPGALGVNPLLTISAITERACELIAGGPIDVRYGPVQFGVADEGAYMVPSRDSSQTPLKGDRPLSSLVEPAELELLAADAKAASVKDWLEKLIERFLGKFCHEDVAQFKQEMLAVFSAGATTVLAKDASNKRKREQLDVPTDTEFQLWKLQENTISGLLSVYGEQFSQQLSFTETMRGYIDSDYCDRADSSATGLVNKFALAYQTGKGVSEDNAMTMTVTIEAEDMYQLIEDRGYVCTITKGSITCPALFKKPAVVQSGDFILLQCDFDHVESWLMEYKVQLENNQGYLYGRKTLHCAQQSHWWTDLSQLDVSLYRREQDALNNKPPRAIGLLKLTLQDFFHQIDSFEAKNKNRCISALIDLLCLIAKQDPATIEQTISKYYVFKLAGVFGQIVFRAYGGLLANLKNFPAEELQADPDKIPFNRPLKAPPPEHLPAQTGEKFKLTRYRGKGTPVILAPGMGVNASSFATSTVAENIVEYLTNGTSKAKRDVWLLDYRASFDSGYSTEPFTIDDIAQADWPKAIDRVLTITGAKQVQIVAHCVGSMTLLMGLLAGYIERAKIRSIVSSQLTLHPVTNWLNNAKADSDFISVLKAQPLIQRRHCTVSMNSANTPYDHALDVLAYQVPVPQDEHCNNPACHRIFSVYGPSYLHHQLNHETHITMADWFKDIHLQPFEQLAKIIHKGYVVNAAGENTYFPEKSTAVEGLDLPIAFIAGALNLEFLPETLERTYQWLCAHNPPRQADYHRYVIDGYGHMDCFVGKDAHRDVFPKICEYLEMYNPQD